MLDGAFARDITLRNTKVYFIHIHMVIYTDSHSHSLLHKTANDRHPHRIFFCIKLASDFCGLAHMVFCTKQPPFPSHMVFYATQPPIHIDMVSIHTYTVFCTKRPLLSMQMVTWSLTQSDHGTSTWSFARVEQSHSFFASNYKIPTVFQARGIGTFLDTSLILQNTHYYSGK